MQWKTYILDISFENSENNKGCLSFQQEMIECWEFVKSRAWPAATRNWFMPRIVLLRNPEGSSKNLIRFLKESFIENHTSGLGWLWSLLLWPWPWPLAIVKKCLEVPIMAHCYWTLWLCECDCVNHSEKSSAKRCWWWLFKIDKDYRNCLIYISEGSQPKGVRDFIKCWIFMKRISTYYYSIRVVDRPVSSKMWKNYGKCLISLKSVSAKKCWWWL